ncbi:LIM domain-containing protein WLIM1 [Ananas comosus]|uniref:LIM domain-containing protein WLIM1 n=1 Tax=Ananas comosus TaxID=4615 RepID=A0A199VX94_ANACO|nr:LIM domain-containing protein WLIM1 [Ananas comosus]
MAFQGTTTKCTACDKTVYLVDKLTADNRIYHKACFRCHHCKGTLKALGLAYDSPFNPKVERELQVHPSPGPSADLHVVRTSK